MAERTPLFMDISNAYSGDELGLPYRDILGEGIIGAGHLAVSAGAGNTINIAQGAAWVLGDTDPNLQPLYRVYNDAVVNLGINPDPSNPRRVLVVAQVTDQTFSGASRNWQLQAIHGVPAGAPVVPATPASALPLSSFLVPTAAASSAAYTFTDLRTAASVGGGQASGAGLVKIWDSVEAGVALPAASITTPTLPQTFKHLRIEIVGATNAAVTNTTLQMRMNGDTGANYYFGGVQGGIGTAAGSTGTASANQIDLGFVTGTTVGGGNAGVVSATIIDYARAATLFKSFVSPGGGVSAAGTVLARVTSGMWVNAGPVTTLTFFPGAGSFIAGSRITVYGEA